MYLELKLRLRLQKASMVTWMQKTWKLPSFWYDLIENWNCPSSQVCCSVLFSAPCPDFIWVSLPYLVRWVSNHFFTVLTGKFLVAASCSQSLSFFGLSLKLLLFLSYSSLCCLMNSTMASSSVSLRKMDFIWSFFCLDWVDSTSVSVSLHTLYSPLSGLSSLSLSILSLSLSSCSILSLSSLSSLSLLLLSISAGVSSNSNCGWVSAGSSGIPA